jgi:nucleoside phosphorylase
MILRTAVGTLMAKIEIEGHQLEDNINGIFLKMPTLREKYMRPDLNSDRLYRRDIIHQPGDKMGFAALCGDDTSALLFRTERTEHDDNPKIHYGIIALANRLMEDTLVRDSLAVEMDVLCFEMEAVEPPNDFPCLVICGICDDYPDSHKTEKWQGYAAMTAAAYTRELLSQIPSSRIEAEKRISDTRRRQR